MKNTDHKVVLRNLVVLLRRDLAVKTHHYLFLAVLLFILPGIAGSTTAQGAVIRIINQRTDRVKVCVYKSSDWTWVAPVSCWTLDPKRHADWDRGHAQAYFDVRVFQPGILDRVLCERRELSNSQQLLIAAPCAITPYNPPKVMSPPVPKPAPAPKPQPETEVVVTICNRSGLDSLRFAIAYVVDVDVGGPDFYVVTEGWWEVVKDECKNVPLSARMKKWRNPALPAGVEIIPNVYIYGESGRFVKRVWEGEGNDPEYCIKNSGNFEYRQATEKKRECFGSKHERVRMNPVPRRGSGNSKFLWNFG